MVELAVEARRVGGSNPSEDTLRKRWLGTNCAPGRLAELDRVSSRGKTPYSITLCSSVEEQESHKLLADGSSPSITIRRFE